MTLLMIIACSVLVLLESPTWANELTDTHHLELPQLTDLEVPVLGPPLTQPQIPTGFFGCWVGNPRNFDAVLPGVNTNSLYRLHRITKCYLPNVIETQEFMLDLTPKHRILDTVLSFLSLGSHRAEVARDKTDLFKITANQIYSRANLTLNLTETSLLKFPQSRRATVVDEEVATLVDPDNLTIAGRAFLTDPRPHCIGTWHADFHR